MKTYLSVLSTDDYLPGALVLAESLRRVNSQYPLVLLVPTTLSAHSLGVLKAVGIEVIQSPNDIQLDDYVANSNTERGHPHWNNTLFKLKIVDLCQYEKIVFLDCDMMILRNIDELFSKPHMSCVIAGRSFPGNEHYVHLGSGLMVVEPREGLLKDLVDIIPDVIESAKGKSVGDQDVFQRFYPEWPTCNELHLDETYNMFFPLMSYYMTHTPMRYGDVRIVHFIGKEKPWALTSMTLAYARICYRAARYQRTLNCRSQLMALNTFRRMLRQYEQLLT